MCSKISMKILLHFIFYGIISGFLTIYYSLIHFYFSQILVYHLLNNGNLEVPGIQNEMCDIVGFIFIVTCL